MERKQIEEIGRLLGLDTEQLESLFVACPVGGWSGSQVAAELCERFGLEADEPLGKQLWAAGVLTQAQGRWLDDEDEVKEFSVYEDNAGGIYLFVFGGDNIEYSFEYTGTAPGQLRDDLAELHRTGTTADWDHEFCLPEPEQTLATLRAWVDEGTGGAKLIADQDGIYLDRAGVAGRLALGDELYTVAEAAEALELSEHRVRVLCQEGRMGKKVGRDWVISAEDIEAMKDRPGPGRPRKMAE